MFNKIKNTLPKKDDLNESEIYYLFHKKRYDFLISLVCEYFGKNSKILDVGYSRLTGLLSNVLNTQVDVLDREKINNSCGNSFVFDLNDSLCIDKWPKKHEKYNIIILAEVIEHLYTSPVHVLSFLDSFLADDGIMIIQTPNAVALGRRISMLLGSNPFELIRVNPEKGGHGHIREYTAEELIKYSNELGFDVDKVFFKNYFNTRYGNYSNSIRERFNYVINNFIPLGRRFKLGITLVLKKRSSREAV